MNTLFINLTATQASIAFAIPILIVLFAAFVASKREKGFTQLFWLFGIICIPPFFAIFYLLKIYAFNNNIDKAKA